MIAFPGGIKNRGKIWNTLEEMRCNKDFANKQLCLVNKDGGFNGLLNDMEEMQRNGTAKRSDFSKLSVLSRLV